MTEVILFILVSLIIMLFFAIKEIIDNDVEIEILKSKIKVQERNIEELREKHEIVLDYIMKGKPEREVEDD